MAPDPDGDIVDELREHPVTIAHEAADEIERLRDILRVIVVDIDPCMDGPRPRLVSRRLTPEQGVVLQSVLDGMGGDDV